MKNLILTGKITATLSFIFGTIILSLFLYFNRNANTLIISGYIFTLIAIIINIIVFIILIISAVLNTKYRYDLLKTGGIMLLNIPIAVGYFFLVLHILFPSKG